MLDLPKCQAARMNDALLILRGSTDRADGGVGWSVAMTPLPVICADRQVSLLPKDASDGIGLGFTFQSDCSSCLGFEQGSEEIPCEVWRRG